ncbi:putative retrotransposon protein [Tanacetum coccineum]
MDYGCCCPKHKQFDYQVDSPCGETYLTKLYELVSELKNLARDAYDALFDVQNEVACLMLGTMSPDLQSALENYKAYDMIQELKTMLEAQAKQELYETVKAFHACKQEDGPSISSYLLKMKSYLDTLERLGYVVPNELGIPKKAKTPVVFAIREGRIQKEKKKPQGEKGKDKGKNKLAYAPKPKIPPPHKRYNLPKDSVCHHCKEVGHWRMNYPSYQAELRKKKNASGASTSGIFTIELYAFPNKSWVYDTGCGTHICNTSQGLKGKRKLKHGALSMYVGNGIRAIVEAIRSFDLVLPSGLIIVLDNCYYAPTITRGVVSISRLIENGYIHTFTNYGIFVSKDDVFYFNAIPHDEASRRYGILKVSGSDVEIELIQEDDTQPSENTSKIHDEVEPNEVESQSMQVPICRSGRISQAPDRYGFYVDAEEHELGDLNEPPNYKAALLDLEFDKWFDAMNMEMKSMKDNQVWSLVDLPPNGQTVGNKWLFKKKTDMDGNVHTFKARLVEKGFTQTYRVDYGETFSSITDIRAIRILLAIVAFYDYEIWQMDVKTAFLNGHLREDVYMVQPDEFMDPKHLSKVCKFQHFIYGLKCTRPGVALTQNLCSLFQKNLGDIHWTVVKAILKYLRNTKDMVLVYVAKPKSKLKVTCYADDGFQSDKDDIKSHSGYVFVLNGGAVDSKSAKQSSTAMSSTEAEYIATSEASIEAVWMRKFIDGLGDVMPSNKRPMEMLCDNAPAIAIANDLEFIRGAKHYQSKYHYVREVIQAGETVLKKVHTDDNLANLFTKPMPYNKHFEHAMEIGVCHASSLM